MEYTIKVVNTETGEEIIREANAEESEQFDAIKAATAIEEAKVAEAQTKRQALLAKLGITADEARLLLGGN